MGSMDDGITAIERDDGRTPVINVFSDGSGAQNLK